MSNAGLSKQNRYQPKSSYVLPETASNIGNALVCRHEVFDIDESIFAAELLKHFQSGVHQFPDAMFFPLTIFNAVSKVVVIIFEYVENGQDLSVVGDKCLSDQTL